MLKTTRLLATALLATGVSAAALAATTGGDRHDTADWAINPTWVVYDLQDRIPGTLLSVKQTRDGFVARVAGESGTLRRIAIDPMTGETRSDEVERNFSAAGLISLAEVVPAVAETGWWDLRSATYKGGVYEIVAGNDAGRVARIEVDARTGKVFNADVLARANGVSVAG